MTDHTEHPRYSMLIQWNGEAFTVTFPDFPGHQAQGSSWEDAAKNGGILLGQILEDSEQPVTNWNVFNRPGESSACSFCDRQPDQIERLTRGPGGVNICNACIDVCSEVLADNGGFDDMRIELAARRSRK